MRQLFTLILAAGMMYGCASEQKESTETESTTDSVIIESDVKESNIIGEEVSYSADGVEMKGYMVIN
jgi:uncharacterized protein YcfL